MSEPMVLDPASGGRMMYFDKQDPRVLFGDIRDESWELCDGRRFDVHPDRLMDYRHLPFADGSYRLVVFDPPHLVRGGDKSYMVRKYGRLSADWRDGLEQGFSECFRVLEDGGVLIFKWYETQIPVSQILACSDRKPLFGNRQPKQTGTHWIVWVKEASHDVA